MTDRPVRASSTRSGHADGQQADPAGALVEMITRRRELERTGTAVTAYDAVHAESTSRGDDDVSSALPVGIDRPGAQPAHRQEAVSVTGHGASAADALLTVFAIDEEQWARLLADLPLDALTELLGHVFGLYQRIALEETNRRFE